jgi:hypothetical protein
MPARNSGIAEPIKEFSWREDEPQEESHRRDREYSGEPQACKPQEPLHQ